MKKLMIMAAAVMAMATSYSQPSWALVNTEGYNGDDSGAIANYKAYFLAASDGLDSIESVQAYFSDNGFTGAVGLMAMNAYGYDDGIYSFSKYFEPGTLDGDYFAVVSFNDQQFRVFENVAVNDTVRFNPGTTGGGEAGQWTSVVPEPTSGLLMLFGLAGLALKRRKA